ncbi:hypothetical protein [Kribbella ginsengisoli]|uniref:hypothetical protein n=1 Tax=Kribbella ginsengisoli TaxID=363865 RepID=UPI0031DE06CA
MNPLRGKTMLASAMSMMVRPTGRRRPVATPASAVQTGTPAFGPAEASCASADDTTDSRASLNPAPMSYSLIGW